MKSKKPIIVILGVPGQFYLAEALSKEFDRPVIGITNYARVEKAMQDKHRAVFKEIWSFPDFYFKNKTAAENMEPKAFDEAFRKMEKKLGIENSATIAHFDRAIRWGDDYKLNRVFQYCTLLFIDKLLEETKPAFVMDGVTTYLQLAMRKACEKNKIPSLMTENSRLSGHMNVSQADGRYIPMAEIFERLQKGDKSDIDPALLEEADAKFHEFVNKPARPTYALKNSALGFDIFRTLRNLSYTLSPQSLFPGDEITNLDRAMRYERTPLFYLWNGVTGKLRRLEQKLLKIFDDSPDMNAPFVYLPLHFAPENSDMYFGANYDHHAGFVSQLAKHIPSHCQLYVKEHPSMVGRRPTSFYKELKSIYNVSIIAPSVDTFELTKNAELIATVTGTAGWEGYLFGKPILAMGDVFYNFLPSVCYAQIDNNLSKVLNDYLANFKEDKEEKLNAFRAFYASCFVGTAGDIGPDIPYEKARSNAKLFAQSIRSVLVDWPDSVNGNIPKDL